MGAAPVRILYTVTVVGWLVMELRQARHTRPEADATDRGSRYLLHASYVLGLVAALVLRARAPGGDIHPRHLGLWLGLPVLWAGVGLRLWSIRTLGRYFTFTVQTSADQPVVTGGPYRLVRHPSYAGLLCAFAGVGLVIGNWWSLLAFTGATACGVVRRILVEEQALTAALGEPYREYAAAHKRLVPFIW